MKLGNIVLLGANGQLGYDLYKCLSLKFNVKPLTRADIEISDKKKVNFVLNKIKPEIIINTAAYTRVDEAELYPQKAFESNSIGVKYLAEYCLNNQSIFVHFSTDYVFGGDRRRTSPYTENDSPSPINTYGISKLAGEYYILNSLKKYFVIRTAGLFGVAGTSGKGNNFVELMLSISKKNKVIQVVRDQITTPTPTADLAKQTETLLRTNAFGLYHISAHGQCSWYEFACEIFRQTKVKTKIVSVTEDLWITPASRPKYSVLENSKLSSLGIDGMNDWEKGLKEYLKTKKYI